MLYTKSRAAFIMSASRMWDLWPNRIYFWTFTFKECLPDAWAMRAWEEFKTRLHWRYGCGGIQGVRVVEVHPGERSHGLHFHALVNRRVCIHWANRVAAQCGFGWLDVRKARKGDAVYLSKYLSERWMLPKGCRAWGTIGGYRQCKVSRIERKSNFDENMRKAQQMLDKKQLPFQVASVVLQQTTLWGPMKNWPVTAMEATTGNTGRRKPWADKLPAKRTIREADEKNLSPGVHKLDNQKRGTIVYVLDKKRMYEAGTGSAKVGLPCGNKTKQTESR